jgi:hypothetical protein
MEAQVFKNEHLSGAEISAPSTVTGADGKQEAGGSAGGNSYHLIPN